MASDDRKSNSIVFDIQVYSPSLDQYLDNVLFTRRADAVLTVLGVTVSRRELVFTFFILDDDTRYPIGHASPNSASSRVTTFFCTEYPSI